MGMEGSGIGLRARVLRNVSYAPLVKWAIADLIDLRGSPEEVVKRVQTIFR
jgi:hypothetical protein